MNISPNTQIGSFYSTIGRAQVRQPYQAVIPGSFELPPDILKKRKTTLGLIVASLSLSSFGILSWAITDSLKEKSPKVVNKIPKQLIFYGSMLSSLACLMAAYVQTFSSPNSLNTRFPSSLSQNARLT